MHISFNSTIKVLVIHPEIYLNLYTITGIVILLLFILAKDWNILNVQQQRAGKRHDGEYIKYNIVKVKIKERVLYNYVKEVENIY